MVRFYAESSLTCKFELTTAILNFERFEVSKNPMFHKSSLGPKSVRFVLVTLRADLRSRKIRFFTTHPGDLKWCVLC